MMYNKLLEWIVLPLGDLFTGNTVIRQLRKLREEQWLPEKDLCSLRKLRVGALLEAAEGTAYYRGFSNDSGKLKLSDFPVLTKADLVSNPSQFLNSENVNTAIKISTSGSTGVKTTIQFDKNALSRNRAIQLLWWEWAGYSIGSAFFQTGNNAQRGFFKGVKDFLFRTKYVPAFNHSNKDLKALLALLVEGKYKYFGGFASSMVLLAEAAESFKITGIRFKSCISWGSKMPHAYREKIEKVFNTKVYDTYGAAEGFNIASQCQYGKYHTIPSHVIVEILDEKGKEVDKGGLGHLVLTRLDNLKMPLIRYKIGDLAVKGDGEIKKCECGRHLPEYITEIIGRETEIIKIHGVNITIHFATGVFKHFNEVKQFRVIQNRKDFIDVEIIPNPDFDHSVHIPLIQKSFDEKAGIPVPMEVTIVNTIPNTKSGKPQLLISKLN